MPMVPLLVASGIDGIHCATTTSNGARLARQSEQLPEREQRDAERRGHHRAGDGAGRLAREVPDAQQAVDRGADGRQQRNQPDVSHYQRIRFISSMLTLSLLR